VQLHPRVSGYIDSVAFVEGARVRKGQLLFRIDPRPFQYEVDRLQAEQQRAQSHLDFAVADKARAVRLMAQNAIAREEYDQLVSAAAEAQADLASIRAQFETARLNLSFTQVRSPIDGHVSRALINAGNLVTTADVLTNVVSDDPIYAYFDTDEATYLNFTHAAARADGRSGSPVYLGLTGENGYPHAGRLDFLDNQVDPRTGTIRARAVFDNHDGRYTPGLFARIKLVARDSYAAVLVDDTAIGTDLGKKYVLVLKTDASLQYRAVDLGPSIGDLRIVQSGLSAGDVVVVDGLQHVMPGVKVQATRVGMVVDAAARQQLTTDDAPRPLVSAISLR
jgi:multidrug efflux system membrane fusion protein